MRAFFLLAALLLAAPTFAQTAAHPEAAHADAEARPPLPADSVTHHTLTLPGRTLHFTATAGAFRITDAQGKPQADIATIAYTLDGADPSTRPVAFAVNGGPGASSAWLQLGALGPWRLALEGPPFPVLLPRAGAERRNLARLHRPRVHRPAWHRIQPARQHRRRAAAELLLGRGRHPAARRSDPALDGQAGPHRLAAADRGRKLWRVPRPPAGARAADRRGAGRDRAGAGLAGAGFRLAEFRHRPDVAGRPAALDGGGGGRDGRPRARPGGGRAIRRHRISSPTCCAGRAMRRRSSA